jgi:hypothetical protein
MCLLIQTSPTPIFGRRTPNTISDVQGTRVKDYEINDAILIQADAEVPLSGYDSQTFTLSLPQTGEPANPTSLTADETVTVDGTQGGMSVTPKCEGYARATSLVAAQPPMVCQLLQQ